MYFIIFLCFLLFLRILELIISKKNERWLLQNGAIEYGQKHYPIMILLHTCFILSLIVEYWINPFEEIDYLFLILFFLSVIIKVWVIASLGKYWNTKIIRIPDMPLIEKGLYRYFKHPNYVIVVFEIAIIPLIFHLYFTAILFSILNACMLYVRIKEENKALAL